MKMKKFLSILLVVGMILSMMILPACEKSKGDGKTSCKNCGRTPVYALGFCKSCYKSFHDYTYGKNSASYPQ